MKISRYDLLQALDSVKGAVAEKNFVPILTHVLISDNFVLGYDSEIGIRVKLPNSVGVTFNVRFAPFLELVKALDDEDIEIDVLDKKRISIKCGKHKSNLPQLEEEFPKPQISVKKEDWQDTPAGFKEGLERALFATSNNEQDALLTAILINGNKMLSTDRFRAVRCTLPKMDLRPFLLPKRGAEEIIRLGNPKRVAVSNSMAVFDYLNLTLLCRLQEGAKNFPPVERLFEGRKAEDPVPDGLKEALNRLVIFASGEEPRVITSCDLQLTLSTEGERGNVTEYLDLPKVPFAPKGFGPEKLLGALAYSDNISWGKEANQPIYLCGEIAGFEYCQSPMVLN